MMVNDNDLEIRNASSAIEKFTKSVLKTRLFKVALADKQLIVQVSCRAFTYILREHLPNTYSKTCLKQNNQPCGSYTNVWGR